MVADTLVEREDDVEPFPDAEEPTETTPPLEEALVAPTKGGKRPKGRPPKGKKHEVVSVQATTDVVEVEEEPAVEDKQPISEEDILARKEATTYYEDVAKQFRAFREHLTNERLAQLTSELKLLSEPESAHPEYLRQVACVDTRLKKQISEAHAYYNYRMRSMRDRVLGDRSQLHSQHFQSVRELRDEILNKLGEDWYAIQKERRSADDGADDRYIYKFPKKMSDRVKQQAKYNQEVSILSGMAKYVGFPAAPDLAPADDKAWEEDMRAMRVRLYWHHDNTHISMLTRLQISKRAAQPTHGPQPLHQQAPAQQPIYLSGPTVPAFAPDERLAHEQFIEANAWARPQAPIHQTHAHPHGSGTATPGISHTPDWAAEPSTTARHMLHNLYQRNQLSSPLATPARQLGGGEGLEGLPSSVLAHPPTASTSAADRMNLLAQLSRTHGGDRDPPSSSPLIAVPKSRLDGGELTGFRNFSGISAISGASTIDAPLGAANEQDGRSHHGRRHDEGPKHPLPHLLSQPSAPQQAFDTSQLHRYPGEGARDVHPTAGFRPKDGAFGTPTPGPMAAPFSHSGRAEDGGRNIMNDLG